MQAINGCGKTGSFTIGSTLRVDRSDPNIQIICLANTRELVNQIHDVYEKIVKGTGITLLNYGKDKQTQAQIIVTIPNKLETLMKQRNGIDLSSLKCIVMDEADVFFTDDKNFTMLKNIAKNKAITDRPEDNRVQWLLFSATYPEGAEAGYEEVQRRVSEIVEKAQQIKVKSEKM